MSYPKRILNRKSILVHSNETGLTDKSFIRYWITDIDDRSVSVMSILDVAPQHIPWHELGGWRILVIRVGTAANKRDIVERHYLHEISTPPNMFIGISESELTEMTNMYLTTALWAEIGDDDEPLDNTYGLSDISPEMVERARNACRMFYLKNWRDLRKAERDPKLPNGPENWGNDLWLNRNGHGAGFWDGDYPAEIGERLSKSAERMRECDIYVGDDGKLYFE